MTPEELSAMIELYLKGHLPEGHTFLKKLQEDEALQEEVQLHKISREAVLDYQLLDFQKSLQSYHLKNTRGKKTAQGKYTGLLFILLLITATVLYTGYKFFSFKTETPSSVASQEIPIVKESYKNTITIPSDSGQTTLSGKKTNKVSADARKSAAYGYFSAEDKTTGRDLSSGAPILKETNNISKETGPVHTDITAEEVTAIPVSPCNHITMTATVNKTLPCPGKNDGVLKIENVQGGSFPYDFSFNAGKDFQKENIKDQLPSGNYNLWVRDASLCIQVLDSNVRLENRSCMPFKKFHFNPESGGLEITREIREGGIFTIYDKHRSVIVHRVIQGTDVVFWDGYREGNLVAPGVYMFMLEYTSGQVEQGSITVIY